MDEYADLAASVTLSQRLTLHPGPNAGVLLQDSQQQPLALVTGVEGKNPSRKPDAAAVVLFGFAFDVQWTDLPARPLFVAITHELIRTLLARSIAPDVRAAGFDADELNLEQLESISPDAVGQSDERMAGAFVSVDSLGASRRGVIINPDSTNTGTERSNQETPSSALARSLESIEIQDLSSAQDLSTANTDIQQGNGRSIALVLFTIAAVLGILEFLLARRCSFGASRTGDVQPRGAA
jgi:hypothetical protein